MNRTTRIPQICILLFMLSAAVLFTSCGTSMSSLKTNAQTPDEGNAIVVGSFTLEPVPQWEDPDENYWLSIWKNPVPRSEYTITLHPNKREDILIQLPAGMYEIEFIYEGEQGNWSRGHGRKGALGYSFEVEEGEVLYLGDLKLIISPQPEYLRWKEQQQLDIATRLISKALLDIEISGKPVRPKMYTIAEVEDNLQDTIENLKEKGWSEHAVKKLKKSLIITSDVE